MRTLTTNRAAQQMPLDPAMEEELVLAKARQLYEHSRVLSGKYASFNRLMADPVAAQCLRLCARQVLRSASRKRGR